MTQKEMMSTEEFEKMLQDSYTYKLNVADVVKGVAVKKEKDGYLVDIGAKTEAFLPIKEVINFPEQNPDELIKLWEVKEFYVMKDEYNITEPDIIKARKILGLRYTIDQKGYSSTTGLELAANVSKNSIGELEERKNELSGISIETKSNRVYVQGSLA